VKRLAGVLMALLLAGCRTSSEDPATESNYQQLFKLARQSFDAAFGQVRITREQAAAIPYASMGYTVNDGNEAILVLATDSGGELLWTSASHVVIVSRDGRIVRTVGLGTDLGGLTARSQDAPRAPAAALKGPFASTRLEDFPDLGLYGVIVSCRAVAKGRETIQVLGQAIATTRVDEACESRTPSWSFVDSYWVDGDNGLVWRSRQHINPEGGEIETEIFRPPG
jgi:hypothetical protein